MHSIVVYAGRPDLLRLSLPLTSQTTQSGLAPHLFSELANLEAVLNLLALWLPKCGVPGLLLAEVLGATTKAERGVLST